MEYVMMAKRLRESPTIGGEEVQLDVIEVNWAEGQFRARRGLDRWSRRAPDP